MLTILSILLILQSGDIDVNPGPSGLSMCYINVQSRFSTIRSKHIDEIQSLLVIGKGYDLICINETWLKPSISNDAINVPDVQFYRKYRDGGSGWGGVGVAIYARDLISVKAEP